MSDQRGKGMDPAMLVGLIIVGIVTAVLIVVVVVARNGKRDYDAQRTAHAVQVRPVPSGTAPALSASGVSRAGH